MSSYLREVAGTFIRATALVGAALAIGLTVNAFSPAGIPLREKWSERIEAKAIEEGIGVVNLSDVKQMISNRSSVVLDARPASDYAAGHIPSAISLPLESFDDTFPQLQLMVKPKSAILVYCKAVDCDESLLVAGLLRQQGYLDISLFAGGFDVWSENRLPTEKGE